MADLREAHDSSLANLRAQLAQLQDDCTSLAEANEELPRLQATASDAAVYVERVDEAISVAEAEHAHVVANLNAEATRLADLVTSANEKRQVANMRRLAQASLLATSKKKLAATEKTLGLKDRQILRVKRDLFDAVDALKSAKADLDEAAAAAAEHDDAVDVVPPAASGGPPGGPAVLRRANGNPKIQRNILRWKSTALGELMKRFGDAQLVATVDAIQKELGSSMDAIKLQASKLSYEQARDHLNSDVLARIERDGAREFARAQQDHLDVVACTQIKYQNALSRRKYQKLRQALSGVWCADEGRHVRLEFNEVQFPILASRYAILKFVGEIKEKMGVEPFCEGKGAKLDLRTLLSAATLESVDRGFFEVTDDNNVVQVCDGQAVEAIVLFDAANHHKGMKVTEGVVMFPQGSHHPQSPTENFGFAQSETSDDNAGLTGPAGKPMTDAVNDLIANPTIVTLMVDDDGSPVVCKMNVSAGGDHAFVGASNCISGCNGPNPCTECLVDKNSMCVIGKKFPKRTRFTIQLKAHVVQGFCPCCQLWVVDTADGRKLKTGETAMLRAPPSAPLPVPKKLAKDPVTGKKVSSLQLHDGVVAGQNFPFDFEPSDWCICLLHCRLCIIGAMFKKSIVNALTKPAQQKQVYQMMKASGMVMKESRLSTKSKKLDVYDMTYKSFSMAGRDTERLWRLHERMLQVAYPLDERGPWLSDEVCFGDDEAQVPMKTPRMLREEARSKAKVDETFVQLVTARRMWRRWGELWTVLNSNINYKSGETNDSRADKVQGLAEVFVRAHVEAVGASQGLYLHLVHAHVADHIRRWGDIRLRQAQGLEHRHKLRKRLGCECTNRRPTSTYHNTRVMQMLMHTTVADFVARLMSNNQYAKEHATKKHQLEKREEAKAARVAATMPCIDHL
jgi:hypothetical protein